jgi:hypothetical protein
MKITAENATGDSELENLTVKAPAIEMSIWLFQPLVTCATNILVTGFGSDSMTVGPSVTVASLTRSIRRK